MQIVGDGLDFATMEAWLREAIRSTLPGSGNKLPELPEFTVIAAKQAPEPLPIAAKPDTSEAVSNNVPQAKVNTSIEPTKIVENAKPVINPDVAAFAIMRMERSFDAARKLVACVDRLSLAEGRRVTKQLVALALQQISVPNVT